MSNSVILGNTVWVCGFHNCDINANDWTMVGIYTTRQKAIAQCEDYLHFIAPIELDSIPGDSDDWPGYYRPLAN